MRVNEMNSGQKTLQRNNHGGKVDNVGMNCIEHLSKFFWNLSGGKVFKKQSRNKPTLQT